MSKSYSDRVMRFRRGVFAGRRHITPGCALLLLRLSDSMDAKGIVSVPRTTLSADLDAPPSRITEWVAEARRAGYLDQVRRARPQVTAVYQGLYVEPLRYAQHLSQVVVTQTSGQTRCRHPPKRTTQRRRTR